MISCVRSLVWVIQHAICGGCIARVPMKLITGAGSSPGCRSSCEKSTVRPSSRGGVPVLRRPAGSASSRRRRPRVFAGGSPARPASKCSSPTWISPDRKVPVVSTTASASNVTPICVITPVTLGPAPQVVDREVVDRLLKERQVGLVLEAAADRGLVEHPVRLRARRPHGRPLARIESTKLDPGFVRRDGHRAAQRVDLLDEMTLADASDRRVARHLTQGLDVMREQERSAAHPRAGERRLGPGVATADDDNFVTRSESHDFIDVLLHDRHVGRSCAGSVIIRQSDGREKPPTG